MTAAASIRPELAAWCAVADLIGKLGGRHCEAVLHDLAQPKHSVVYVVNGHVTGRALGQSFRHLIAEMLRRKNDADSSGDLLPQWWFEHEGRTIRSLTLLIRNVQGQVIGALCVNQDVSQAADLVSDLSQLLPGLENIRTSESQPVLQQDARSVEKPAAKKAVILQETAQTVAEKRELINAANETVPEVVFRMIDNMVAEVWDEAREDEKETNSKGRTVLRRRARQDLVRFMNERGVFCVKGSVEHAAAALGVSQVTVYSDLNCLTQDG